MSESGWYFVNSRREAVGRLSVIVTSGLCHAQVVKYLGCYTHKIAITRHRIVEMNDTHIQFRYKDYADGDTVKEMTLTHQEFLRRFEQHILPKQK